MYLYTGGYTVAPDGRAAGIGVYRFDPATGALDHLQTVAGIANPSWVAIGPGETALYAVTESGEGGSVVAYARDPATGALHELNRQSSGGSGPCHLSIEASGRYLLVANYGSGSVAALPIAGDGSLEPPTSAIQHEGSSVRPDRQEGPHAHMIASTPDGRYVFATDLGTDEVIAYGLDLESGNMTRASGGATTAPGAGPRHFAFSPDGGTVYVLNELGFTLVAYAYDPATGGLDPRQTVPTLPEGFDAFNLCAHVVVAPDGRFVYASNRGHDSIAVWAVERESGELRFVRHIPSGGQTPRNFALDPTGEWLLVANQDSDNVVISRRGLESGLPTGEPLDVAIPSCCCLVFAGA